MHKFTTLTALLLVAAATANGQTMILGWDFDTNYGAGSAPHNTVGGTATTGTASTFNAPNVNPSLFNIGLGGTSVTTTLGSYRTRGYDAANVAAAISNNDYFTFTVSAVSGTIGLDRIELYSQSAAEAQTLELRSSLDGFTTSLGSFTEPVTNGTNATRKTLQLDEDFASITTVEFRLYIYNSASTRDAFEHHVFGNTSLDDNLTDIAVYAVPEPGAFVAIFGLLSLGVVLAVRRRRI